MTYMRAVCGHDVIDRISCISWSWEHCCTADCCTFIPAVFKCKSAVISLFHGFLYRFSASWIAQSILPTLHRRFIGSGIDCCCLLNWVSLLTFLPSNHTTTLQSLESSLFVNWNKMKITNGVNDVLRIWWYFHFKRSSERNTEEVPITPPWKERNKYSVMKVILYLQISMSFWFILKWKLSYVCFNQDSPTCGYSPLSVWIRF